MAVEDNSFDITTRSGFRSVYDRLRVPLAVFAMRMGGFSADAEDVIQSAFITLWERRDDFRDFSAARSFLYVSVRNRMLDLIDHKKVENRYANHVTKRADLAIAPDDDDDFFTAEVYSRLFKAIDELSPRQREILLMTIKGHENRDIAQAMGIAQDTVRVQKGRALKSLRKKLGEKELVLLGLLAF